jgi:hypothetical protein
MILKAITTLITLCEINYCIIVPIYLYGWLRGLLIGSALTSLLHIVWLLKKGGEGNGLRKTVVLGVDEKVSS